MANEAPLAINVKAIFTGKKAFKQADTATQKLTGSVRKLGGALGIAFSAQALARYGKNAVKAFAADDKAARVLTKTLQNLGLAFADPAVKTFIADLERLYGVADDKLRPAYQKLLTTTGNFAKSQDLLRTALDLSAMSGADVVSVAGDLSRAYAGNTRGLIKYGIGFSKAEIAAKSFDEILTQIAKISGGQAALAAGTISGKMDKLAVASNNVAEILGGALADSFVALAGGGDVEKATSNMEKFATALGDVMRWATGAKNVDMGKIRFGLPAFVGNRPKPLTQGQSPGERKAIDAAAAKADATAKKSAAALLKLEKDRLRTASLLAKSKADALKLEKAALALGKGEDAFDIDKIQIAAALAAKNEEVAKLSVMATDTQRLQIANELVRLSIKRDLLALEDAIASKNVSLATSLSDKLKTELNILGVMQQQGFKLSGIKGILDSLNPKDLIALGDLDNSLAKLLDTSARTKAIAEAAAAAAAAKAIEAANSAAAIGAASTYADSLWETKAAYGIAAIGAASTYADAAWETNAAYGIAAIGAAASHTQAAILVAAANSAAAILRAASASITVNNGHAASVQSVNSGVAYSQSRQGGAQNVTVTVVDKTSGLIDVVQNAVQQANRYGNNLSYAGAI